LVPWFAFAVRAFCFFFDVRFDIGERCYRSGRRERRADPLAGGADQGFRAR
jgi:hypothetical protein